MNEIINHNIFHSPHLGGRICGGDQGWLEGRLRGGHEGGGADRAGDGGEGGAREGLYSGALLLICVYPTQKLNNKEGFKQLNNNPSNFTS